MVCPHCQASLEVPPGQEVSCSRCAGTVPGPDPAGLQWYHARDKKKVGPLSWTQLQQDAAQGKVGATDMVLADGSTRWMQAQSLPGLFAQAQIVLETPKKSPDLSTTSRVAADNSRATRAEHPGLGQRLLALPRAAQLGAVAGLLLVIFFTMWMAWPGRETPGPLVNNNGNNSVQDPSAPTSTEVSDAGKLLARINNYRLQAGLPVVYLEDSFSKGCQQQAEALVAKAAAAKAQDADNKQAAATDLLSLRLAPGAALAEWMADWTSRVQLLHPDLRTIGVGIAGRDEAWATVVDALHGRGELVVLYPGPGQQDVPMHFSGGPEVPLPPGKQNAGLPISASFGFQKRVTDVEASLTDEAGQTVDVWLSTPAKPVQPRGQRNAVCLIPRQPLQPSTTYQVHVAARVNDQPWSKTWTFTTGADLDRSGAWARKALARLNAFRKQAGVPEVMLDDALTEGCRNHAHYLVQNLNHPATQGLGAHDEQPGLPGFTESGRDAGRKGNIALGDHDPLASLDGWMATLYHRVPLLDPRLQHIGFSCARAERLGWISVLNVASGRKKGPLEESFRYPANQQSDVPLAFPSGGEIPDPIPDDKDGKAGYPITMTFPFATVPVNVAGVLKDAAGNDVPAWFSSPEKPANIKYKSHQGPTVCLIPRDPLAAQIRYTVFLQGQREGKPWETSWSFTTEPAAGNASAEALHVLERMNQYRREAGLPALQLDSGLGRGCQAHADYLVANSGQKGKAGYDPNDENPQFARFSEEGKQAARRSDVFTQAPVPTLQVDLMRAGFLRRNHLLDPLLRKVGIGCSLDVGRGWVSVLDLNSGRSLDQPAIYPPDGATQIPLEAGGLILESRTPGYPITATFADHLQVRDPSAVLTDASGRSQNFQLFSPTNPRDASKQGNTLLLIPQRPLEPGMTYRVQLQATLSGQAWQQIWQFTTRRP